MLYSDIEIRERHRNLLQIYVSVEIYVYTSIQTHIEIPKIKSQSSLLPFLLGTAAPTELAVSFQQGWKPLQLFLAQSLTWAASVVGTRVYSLKSESPALYWSSSHLFSSTVFILPILTHCSFLYWCSSLSCFFFPCSICTPWWSFIFFSPSFFFSQRLLLALPLLSHCLTQIVSIIFFIHLSAGCFPPATGGLPSVITFSRW